MRCFREVDRLAATLSNPDFIVFDRLAILFLLAITMVTLGLAAAGIHGSSIAAMDPGPLPSNESSNSPLWGIASRIHADDWGCITPALLYQVRRADRFSPDDSMFGPGKTALLFNLPCRNITMFFRPQFWGFFVLPEKNGFAAYWQFKNWVLLVGLFMLFMLFSRSSGAALFGALWFYFSNGTQWWFSNPMTPEMVGSMAFLVCGVCYLLIGRNSIRMFAAALLTAMAAVSFAMCLYLPILIPLAWIGVFLVLAFAIARRRIIVAGFRKHGRPWALTLFMALTAWALGSFYLDAHSTITALSNTVYPGHRLVDGGDVSLAELASHALSIWENDHHYPAIFTQVHNAAGFYWLAPVAILLAAKLKFSRPFNLGHWSFILMSVLFGVFLLWITVPIPARWGLLFFNRITPIRCQYVLGVVNVMIVVLYLAGTQRKHVAGKMGRLWANCAVYFGALLVVAVILAVTNAQIGHFLTTAQLILAVLLFGSIVFCLIRNYRIALAALVLLPLVWANGLVNPFDRGFHLLDHSELRQVARDTQLRKGPWLVFSDNLVAADFFAGNGFTVFNSCKFVPEVDKLQLLDPQHRYCDIYNQASYNSASPLPMGDAPSFEHTRFFVTHWALSPLDPRLKEIGIRYEAFAERLDEKLVPPGSLRPLYDHPVDGFWLYELPR